MTTIESYSMTYEEFWAAWTPWLSDELLLDDILNGRVPALGEV